MAAIGQVSDISSYINTIFENALFVARDNNLMVPLVTTFGDRRGIATRENSTYGTAVIDTVADTDDLAGQAFTPSSLATITPVEKGGQFLLTDQRLESDPFTLANDASRELGMAMATKMENDLLLTFASLTGGTIGGAGTAITWGHFNAMLSQLRNQKAPLPYAFVCHSYHWHRLANAVTPATATQTNAPLFQDEVLRMFWVRTVGPVDIYVTSNLNVDGSDDAYCAMFSRPAIALDVRRAPRLEPQRDASRRAIELNMTSLYATGVWRPKFGIQATFDASTPTY